MTNGQPVSLSWCQAVIGVPRPGFCYCQAVVGFLIWGTLSDERMGLLFTIASGPHQCLGCRTKDQVVLESSQAVIVVTSSVKEDEKGGQGHTSTSLFASVCHVAPRYEHTLFLQECFFDFVFHSVCDG
jgi:hypothetical protein